MFTSPWLVSRFNLFQIWDEAPTSLSQPAHSSTTLAFKPILEVSTMRIVLPHRAPPAYHSEDSDTTNSSSLWYWPSQDAGPPPPSPS